MELEERRPYRQTARAQAAAEKTARILRVAAEQFATRSYHEVTLRDVAAAADVGLQTLIRRFPTKDDLLAAAGEQVGVRIQAQRGEAPVGDIPGIVANLLEHYEAVADLALMLVQQEHSSPVFRDGAAQGRAVHRAWTARVFAPYLADLDATTGQRRLAQLVTLCDVFTWKLLRREQGLSLPETQLALEELLYGLLGAPE